MNLPTLVGRQSEVLYLPARGHVVVLGTAGSGKTVVAAHRAIHLSDPLVENSGATMLVTFNKALVTYLNHLMEGHPNDLTIRNYHTFARGYLNSRGMMPQRNGIADPGLKLRLITEALREARGQYRPHAILSRSPEFFSDEISWITGNGHRNDPDGYLTASRVGRGQALQQGERQVVLDVLASYTTKLQSLKPYDWDSLACAAHEAMKTDTGPRLYKHIVIDEGQDFTPEMIRSLVAAVPADGSVTFFGDYAQQIYGQGISWQSTGLRVNATHKFKENYRNTREIAALALALSETEAYQGTADLVEPTAPSAGGPKPTLVYCTDLSAELDLAVQQARQLGQQGTVAVLFRKRYEEDGFVRRFGGGARRLHRDLALWDPSPGVFYGTYNAAKGLEFSSVILPFCGADRLPDPAGIQNFGHDSAAARDAKLLYVGVTRARANLIISYTGDPTNLLPSRSELYTFA